MYLLASKLSFLEFRLLLSRFAPYYSSLPQTVDRLVNQTKSCFLAVFQRFFFFTTNERFLRYLKRAKLFISVCFPITTLDYQLCGSCSTSRAFKYCFLYYRVFINEIYVQIRHRCYKGYFYRKINLFKNKICNK